MKRLALLVASIYLLSTACLLAQWQTPAFTRLSTNEGLSQSHVRAILKDSKGFMWFATDEGLNRYDGYKFSIYKHAPENRSSIQHSLVYDILEDKTGTLWVGTSDGLDRFNRDKNNFFHYVIDHSHLKILDIFQDSQQRMWLGTPNGLYLVNTKTNAYTAYRHDSQNETSLSDNFVTKITEDKAGNLWVATQNGLNRFDTKRKQFKRYLHNPANPATISSNWVRVVCLDKQGFIWAGSLGGGISRYNPADNTFSNFLHRPTDPNSLCHNDILDIMDDHQGNLWVGTENGGISIYNQVAGRFTTIRYNIADKTSLSNNSVYCLYKDDISNIWVGTYSGGANFLPKFGAKFRTYRSSPHQNSLSNDIVLTIKGDASGTIWLGTDGGGLNRFDRKTGLFSVFTHQGTVENSPGADYIISVVEVEKNLLALGCHRGGFDLYDTQKGIFTHYRPPNGIPDSLSTISVNVLATDRATNLWVGTWAYGLYFYNRSTKKLTHYTHVPGDSTTISSIDLNAILEDETGAIWVGTENGLDRLDRTTNRFAHFRHNPNDKHSISSNTINCLLDAGKGYMWVGTGGGLCLLNKKTGQFRVINEKNGLPNNVVNAIIYDTNGDLWISTNKGISRYTLRTKAIRNYGLSDGIQGNEFKVGSAYRATDGTLFFGGSEGFNTFHPDSIQDNIYIPPVYITDLQIFNRSVYAGDPNSPLTKDITQTHDLTLSHDQGVFSVEFAALNYTLPQKNQYAYKLEGFDNDWNYIGTRRSATYTNLDQGEYTFRVKASNNDGIWNEQGATLKFTILPPYWKTWWFRFVLTSLIFGSAYAFYRARINTIKAQKWALEQIVDERTERLQQEQVLNKLKSQFVSTASHEFRTPLATIQSSIDLVKMYLDLPSDRGKLNIDRHLTVIEKQISRFIELLDDILTIEKMNAGKVVFSPVPTDVEALCTSVVSTHFEHRADHRTVDLRVVGQPRPLVVDEKVLSQALINLLTNAFKFSATNPVLALAFDEGSLAISVTDEGIGIPEADIPHLFETFFRAGNASAIQGTGLGLFIIKQAVERHGGTVAVCSQENVGTTFTITLPTESVFSQQAAATAAASTSTHPGTASR